MMVTVKLFVNYVFYTAFYVFQFALVVFYRLCCFVYAAPVRTFF